MTISGKEALQVVLQRLVDAKQKGASEEQLCSLITQGSLTLLSYKATSRASSGAMEALRSETAAVKAQVEAADSRLQNLLYEERHYENETRECLNYHSAFSDTDIELMPVDDFRRMVQAGEEPVRPAVADEHALMVARLRHEREAREALVRQLDGLRAQKNELVSSVAQKIRFLEHLRSELAAMQAAAAPSRSALELNDAAAKLPADAEALPLPLYLIYSQLLSVERFGDSGVQLSVVEAPLAEAADAAATEPAEPSGDATMADDGEIRQPEAPAPQVHSRAVQLQIREPTARSASADSSTILMFLYLPAARAVRVTAGAGTPSALLDAVSENDSSRSGRYRWAQRLAGLDFVPESSLDDVAITSERGVAAAATSGTVLAGLAEYRQQQRAEKFLEDLRGARQAVAPQK